jgi:hypothetical protein
MRPKGRLGVFDSLREAVVNAGNGLFEVVGRVSGAVPTPSASSIPEDAPELPKPIPPACELFGQLPRVREGSRRPERPAPRPCAARNSLLQPLEQAQVRLADLGLGQFSEDLA